MAPVRCLVHRLCSRRFSTSSVKDNAALFHSTFAKIEPWHFDRDLPRLPAPRGFPFSIHNFPLSVGFASYDVSVEVKRGPGYAHLRALVLPDRWRIRRAQVGPHHHLKSCEGILRSKGVDPREIADVFAKLMGENA